MYRFTALLLASAAMLSALETPLVIESPLNNELTGVINPSVGTITVYRVQDGQLNQRGSANFLSDLSLYEKWIYTVVDDLPISYLQTGSQNNVPLNGEMINKILGSIKSSKAEATAGVAPLAVRAFAAEKEFWSKEHPYDGVVRAALSQQYLMLVIPSKRTLMVYDTHNEVKPTLVAWHNYGPELYVPQVLTSTPLPSEIMAQLPDDIKADRQKQLADQLDALTQKAEQSIDVKPSEVWIAAGTQERFVLFDHANHHLMSYEFTSKDLKLLSVRNVDVDLLIPSQWHSSPDIQAAYNNFKKDKDHQAYLALNGITDWLAFQVYVESKQSGVSGGGGKVSTLQANVNQTTGEITLDFTDRRKLMVYRFAGGDVQLQLMSFRDYTVDAGIAMLEAEITDINAAKQLYGNVSKLKNPKLQLVTLASALQMNPYHYKDLEKDSRLVKSLGTLEGYAAMVETATKKAAEIDAQREALKKAIEAKRKAIEDAKKAKK